jgi:hypothetical protein
VVHGQRGRELRLRRLPRRRGGWALVRINTKPIAGAGTLDEPSYYQYVDTDIDPSKPYFYYVESISLKGVREKFTPVIKAPAKRPAPAARPRPLRRSRLAGPGRGAGRPASPAPPASPSPLPPGGLDTVSTRA